MATAYQPYRTINTKRNRSGVYEPDYAPGPYDLQTNYAVSTMDQPQAQPQQGGWQENYGAVDPSNPASMIRGQWDRTVGRGDVLNQDLKDKSNEDRQRYFQYGNYLDPMMQDWAEGRGGFSPEEQAQIAREQELQGYMATPGDLNSYYLTGQEQQDIQGNPTRYFNPEDMQARQRESEYAQRNAVDTMENRLYEAAGSPGLGLSGDYLSYTGNTLDTMGRNVRGAIDPTRLRTSEAALQDIRMSPEEQQGYIDAASITAGKAYRAQLQDQEARARAAGVPQAGIGAQRLRYLRNEAADMGDAAAQARMEAGAEKARRAGVAEQMRQSGEDLYTGYAVPAEMQLGQTRLTAGNNVEGMRLDSARDIANRYERAATGVGAARTGTEADIYGQRQRTGEYITNTGSNLESEAARRAGLLATNRQGTARDIVGTRWDQGYAANNALSGRYAGIAGQRAANTSEGRNYFGQQRQLSSGREMEQQAGQRQVYGTQAQGMQGATGNSIAYDQRPRLWEKIAGTAIGVIGAATGSGGGDSSGGKKKSSPYPYGTGGW